jgi:hypothetical protein
MKTNNRPGALTLGTIYMIAFVQFILGVVFVFYPHDFARLMGLAPAPGWTDWIFAQFGARAFGFAYGMWLVLRDPQRHAGWIKAMIGVQVIDWFGTVLAVFSGAVTLAQVTTAPFLPVLVVIVLAGLLRQVAGSTSLRDSVPDRA